MTHSPSTFRLTLDQRHAQHRQKMCCSVNITSVKILSLPQECSPLPSSSGSRAMQVRIRGE